MKKGFSIKISEQKIDIKSFISGQYDDFYLQTEHFDFLLEGVLLNRKKLLHEYALKDFETLIRELYAQKKHDLIKEFEGEIRGFIFDKTQKKLFVFTNITSTQRIFYGKFDHEIFVDTSLVRLNRTLKKANIPVTPELSSLYELLSLECILENKTVIDKYGRVADEVNVQKLNNTIDKLSLTADNLNGVISGIQNGEGSLGKLAKDEQLYQNLNESSANLNNLILDLKANPKRYLNFSVFGKNSTPKD